MARVAGRLTGPTRQHTVWMNVAPEDRTVKHRVHWDVVGPDLQALLDQGAQLLRPAGGDIDWHVLPDPEGNEFCAFTEAAGEPST